MAKGLGGSVLWPVGKCRIDVAGPINTLQRKLEKLTVQDLLDGNEIIRYLKDTADIGMILHHIPIKKVITVMRADASVAKLEDDYGVFSSSGYCRAWLCTV